MNAFASTPTPDALLRTRFSVDYPDKNGVVRNIELTMHKGEILGLIGPSGCGKSTVALALLGLLDLRSGVASGEVWFEGSELLGMSEAVIRAYRGRRLSVVLQSPMTALNPALTVGQQMAEAWRAHRRDDWEEPACQALELAALEHGSDFLTKYPGQLSVGQAQRVLIAMAILHRPSLVIADEPTSALDAVTAAEVLDLFRSLNQRLGTAILMVSHDLAAVASLCHRVAIMEAGAVVETGSRREIFTNPQHPFTRRLVGSLGQLRAEWQSDGPGTAPGLSSLIAATQADAAPAAETLEDRRQSDRRQSDRRAAASNTVERPEPIVETDPLTGLFNTRALFLALDRELARLRRAGTSLTMIITDIDGFEQVNQRFGRVAGDQVLAAIAARLRDQSREYDVLARTNADEFVLVLPEFPVKFLQGRIQRLEQGAAAAAAEVVGEEVRLTTSWAICPDDGSDAEALLAAAGTRLYEAKKAARENAQA